MHRDVFRNGFPGPRLAGVAFVLAPVLLFAGALLLMAFERGSLAERQAALAAEATRAAIGSELFHVGWLLAIVAVVGFARFAAQRAPNLAAVGGFLALMGISVSLFFGGIGTSESALAKIPEQDVALRVIESSEPPLVVLLSASGIAFGWPMLALAGWRGGVLGIPQSVALALAGTLPLWVLGGIPMLMWVPFLGMGVAFVPLGVGLLRPEGAQPRRPTS